MNSHSLLRFFSCSLVAILATFSGYAQTNVFPATGNVGIGTTTPGSPLELRSSQNSNYFTTGQPGNVWGFQLYDYNGGTVASMRTAGDWTEKIRLMSAGPSWFSGGNVGIGTTSPSFALDVSQNNFNAIRAGGNSINSIGIYIQNAAPSGRQWALLSSGGGPSPAGSFTIWDDTAQWARMSVSSVGNVGIGTTVPQSKLAVTGASAAYNGDGVTGIAQFTTGAGFNTDEKLQIGVVDGASGYSWLQALKPGTSVRSIVLQPSGGNVGIGTTNPAYPLSVNGTVRAKEVIVDTGWSDYVFADDYKLKPLSEVEQQIKADKHLPGIPSAKEVADHGVSMGEMQAKLLAKIEELTLHVIAQEKEIKALQAEVAKSQNK